MSAEIAALLACARPADATGATDHLGVALSKVGNWKTLQDAALRHGMLGLLCRRAIDECAEVVPAEALAELRGLRRDIEIRTLRMIRQLLAVAGALDAAGVPVLWFKGPVLSVQLWGDPGIRNFVDLDALVRPQHFRAARDVVLRHGFRECVPYDWADESRWFLGEHDVAFFHPETDLRLELQWRVGPRFQEDSLAAEELFEHTTSLPLLGRDLAVPDLSAFALVHVVHAGKHVWGKIEDVAVMAAVLVRLDPGETQGVGMLANRLRCRRRLHVGVLLAAGLAGAAVPARLLAEARSDRAAKVLASVARARLLSAASVAEEAPSRCRSSSRALDVLWQARSLDNGGATLRHLWRRLVTPGANEWRPVDQADPVWLPGWLATLARRQRRLWRP